MQSSTVIIFLTILGYATCTTLQVNPIDHFGATFCHALEKSVDPYKLFEDSFVRDKAPSLQRPDSSRNEDARISNQHFFDSLDGELDPLDTLDENPNIAHDTIEYNHEITEISHDHVYPSHHNVDNFPPDTYIGFPPLEHYIKRYKAPWFSPLDITPEVETDPIHETESLTPSAQSVEHATPCDPQKTCQPNSQEKVDQEKPSTSEACKKRKKRGKCGPTQESRKKQTKISSRTHLPNQFILPRPSTVSPRSLFPVKWVHELSQTQSHQRSTRDIGKGTDLYLGSTIGVPSPYVAKPPPQSLLGPREGDIIPMVIPQKAIVLRTSTQPRSIDLRELGKKYEMELNELCHEFHEAALMLPASKLMMQVK